MTKTNEGQRAEGKGQRESEGRRTEVTRPTVDALLLDLGRALDVTPSPEFGAKVLARVQRSTPASSLWSWRWGFAAGALVTVVLLTVVTRMNWKSPDTRPHEAHANPTAASPAVDPVPPTPAVAGSARRSPLLRERTAVATRTVQQAQQHHPQILTAPDQATAVRSLLDRFARGNVLSTSLVGNGETPATLEIDELAPIPLIVIPPLDAPPNSGGAGSRE